MSKYFIDQPSVTVSAELTPQFGDIELFSELLQWKEEKKSFWGKIGVGGSVLAFPIIYQDTIYIGCCDKNFYAIGLDGKEKWRFSTNGTIQGMAAAWDGIVYFGSGDKNLYAVDAETGKLVWRFGLAGPLQSCPVVKDGKIYFGARDGRFYCLDAKTSKKLWVFETTGTLASPLIVDNRIYHGYENGVMYCLDMNGNLIWKFETTGFLAAWPPTHYKGNVIFGSWDKHIYCLDVDGKQKWKFKTDDNPMPPVVLGDKVYVGTIGYTMYCLNAETGAKVWSHKAGGNFSNTLAKDGRVYCGSYDNNMYCFDAETGKVIWKYKTNGFVHGAAAVEKGMVIFGGWDCNIYCLDIEGKLIWKFPTSMSSPSQILPPEKRESVKTAEIVWKPETKDEKRKYKKDEMDIADYGSFSGNYVDTSKSEYTSGGKKGYI